jgi:hypothetical protein
MKQCETKGCLYKDTPTYKTDDNRWLCCRCYHIYGYDRYKPNPIPWSQKKKSTKPKKVLDSDVGTWQQLRNEGLNIKEISQATGHSETSVGSYLRGIRPFFLHELKTASKRIMDGESREAVAKDYKTTRHYLLYEIRNAELPVRRGGNH